MGGGVIGCSVAYHLGHLGWKDVLLLERDRLTSGSTWHAAGLICSFGSLSQTSTEMRLYTRDLYAKLPAETGLETGFKPVGFIELAADTDRLEEYRRVAAFNRYCGVDIQEISPTEVAALFPLARTDDLLAGFHVKGDGRANPADVTMALARGARMQGVTIIENTPVLNVLHQNGAVTGVRTAEGDVETEYVINCAGAWARQLGAKSGVGIPLQAAEHYYLITEPIAGVTADLTVIEDPASHGYYREETGGIMVGLFEPQCAPWKVEGIPEDFSFGEISPDWERMAPYIETAMQRVPATIDAGVRKLFCGPESFTPDLQPIVGPAPELRNYFVAAGLNSVGIITGGGMGRVVANWVATGDPGVDVTGFHIDRLHRFHAEPEYLRQRTVESLGMVYQCHYPSRTPQTARNITLSPLHERLRSQGAYFKEVTGWESPDWYAPPGTEPKIEALSWQRQNWFPFWECEHRAARESVILMDMSFMAKFRVSGRGAARALNYISTNNVDQDPGRITYTQWLNERGTIEADLTVAKLDEDSFWIVASDTAHRHVATWLWRHLPEGITVTDESDAYAQINVQGPKSRELLQMLTPADLSNAAFPYRAARTVQIAGSNVLCVRITYLGELGYELYIPRESAPAVYDNIVNSGQAVGLQHAGLKALSSLRMEKAYRDYGHDIDNTDSILEAGLGFTIDWEKPAGFIGRDAVIRKKNDNWSRRRLVQILLKDPEPLLYHAEPVYGDGKALGYIRSASYGHTLGGAIGLAMIETETPITQKYLSETSWQVDIAGRRCDAVASLRPLYDPQMTRITA